MRRSIILLCFLFLLTLMPWSTFSDMAMTNIAGVDTIQFILSSQKTGNIPLVASNNCRAQWLKGLVYNSAGDFESRDELWVSAGKCNPDYIILMSRLVAVDQHLAARMQEAAPASAEAWCWLGDLTPQKAIDYYRRGLELDPMDARRWLAFAGMVEPVDPRAGLEALIRACELGDPGFNACLGAAHRFLALGDTRSAIRILRQATWQDALDFADQLEQELNEGK